MDNIEVTVPDSRAGDWVVDTIEVSKQDAEFANLRAMINRRWTERVVPGVYKRLTRRGTVVMSNTPMEVATHQPIIRAAKGAVLLNGLGLGVVLVAILAKQGVTNVVVVEKSPEVIKLVGPTFESDKRVQIVEGDAFSFKPQGRFNAVWHDIWDAICSDNLEQMGTLHRKYGRRCDWQGSWARAECQRNRH